MALPMPTHIPGGVTIQMSAGRQRFVVTTGVRAVEWRRFFFSSFFLFFPLYPRFSPPPVLSSDWSVGRRAAGGEEERKGEGGEGDDRGGEGARSVARSVRSSPR